MKTAIIDSNSILNCMLAGIAVFLLGFTFNYGTGWHVRPLYLLLYIPFVLVLWVNKWRFWSFINTLWERPLELWLLLFCLWSAFSMIWSHTGHEHNNLFKTFISVIRPVLFIFAVVFVVQRAQEKFLSCLRWCCMVFAVGASLSLLWHYFVLDYPFGYRAFRICKGIIWDIMEMGVPVHAGVIAAAFAVMAAVLLVIFPSVGRIRQRFLWLSFVALSFYLINTWTRGAFIAASAALLVLFIVKQSRTSALPFLFLLTEFLLLFLIQPDGVFNEFTHYQLSGRSIIWQNGLALIRQKWLLGYGLGTVLDDPVNHASSFHNYFFQVIYDSGFIGLCLFLAVLCYAFKTIWQGRHQPLLQAAGVLLVYGTVMLMSDANWLFTWIGHEWLGFWFPLAFVIGAARLSAPMLK